MACRHGSSEPTGALLSHPLKHNMAILGIAHVPDVQYDEVLSKVLGVVIVLVFLDGLPSHKDQITSLMTFHWLNNLAASDAHAAIDVPDNMRPEGPRALIPCIIGAFVNSSSNRIAQQLLAEWIR